MTNIDGIRRPGNAQPAPQPYHPERARVARPVAAPQRQTMPARQSAAATLQSAAAARAAVAQPAPAPPAHTSYNDLHPRRKVITMVGVLLAMLLSALDQTIVGTALPRIVRDLGGADHITWVVTAYMLASTVTVPIYGKLSDLYGRKWFFFSGIVIFLIGSVLCGLSQDMVQLVVFRAIQGIGGGAIMGNAFAIIGDLFDTAERAKWMGVMGGVFGLSSVIGPALGGFLTDHASWHWVFYINLPLGLIALAVIGFTMPKIASHIQDKTIDFWGAGLLVATLVPLLLALSWGGRQYPWDSGTIIGLLAVGLVSLLAFLWAELKARQPILPLDLFKNSIFSTSQAITFLTAAAMFGAIVYIPLFAQLALGVSATDSGTVMTPLMIGLIGASIVSGQIIARTGRYKWNALAGAVMLVLSLLWLSTITASTTNFELIIRMVALGASLGLTMPVFNLAVQNAFDRTKMGVVTAATQLFRNVGGTVGTAVLGAVFNNLFAAKAAALASTSYAQAAQAHGTDVTDPNLVQRLLSSEGQAAMHQTIAKLPVAAQAAATKSFNDYASIARDGFAYAIGHLFLIAAFVAVLALIITFFLKEIPLKKSAKPRQPGEAETEAGVELATEMGQARAKDEPLVRL